MRSAGRNLFEIRCNGAAALQELLGGRFGEMSTLMNYTFQSFNFRGRDAVRPYYDLIASIAAEEYSHIETLSYAINMLLTGSTVRGDDPSTAPLKGAVDTRNSYHFLASGQAALPVDSMGNPWTGFNVTSTGNLKLDLLHNFFLECGARANKIRAYEMVDDPTARTAIAYLLVRGGLHIVAYAKALEKLTGADVSKLLPIPDISNTKFPETKQFVDRGLNQVLFTWSPKDFRMIDQIWNGTHPEDGSELRVEIGMPKGFPVPVLDHEPQLNAPGADLEMMAEMAKKLGIK